MPMAGSAYNMPRMTSLCPVDAVADYLDWVQKRAMHKGAVRTLKDMSEVEILALEEQYGCPVKRPA